MNPPLKRRCGLRVREQYKPLEDAFSLQNVDIILVGGRGIGGREGFETLRKIVAKMGAGLAASRAAVGSGYAPYSCQVGQTGIVVRPKLYIAAGISGSVQHLAGMGGSKKIAATNSDPGAAIFDYADYGITGDWR
jgi:electron transfer flavoprotein alpha subunit